MATSVYYYILVLLCIEFYLSYVLILLCTQYLPYFLRSKSPPPMPSPTLQTPPPTPPPQAPTWDIDFTSMSADFSVNSTDELTLNYDIRKGRNQDVNVLPLLDQDCKTNVTGIIVNATEPLWTPNNSSYKSPVPANCSPVPAKLFDDNNCHLKRPG